MKSLNFNGSSGQISSICHMEDFNSRQFTLQKKAIHTNVVSGRSSSQVSI